MNQAPDPRLRSDRHEGRTGDWAQVVQQESSDRLPLLAGGLAILFFVIAIIDLVILPRLSTPTLAVLAVISSMSAGGIYLLANSKKLTAGQSTWLLAVLAAVAWVNCAVRLWLTGDIYVTDSFILLSVGMGFFWLDTAWFTIFLALIWLNWGVFIWQLTESSGWQYYGLVLLLGTLLAATIHLVRKRSLQKQHWLGEENARFKNELETVLISTEEAQRSLATSMAVGQRITSILDLDTLLNQVSLLIQQRFNLHAVQIYLYDANQQQLQMRAGASSLGRSIPVWQNQPDSGNEAVGVIDWVADHHRPLRLDDVSRDSRYIPSSDSPDTCSELALPLEFGKQLLGVLDLKSSRPAAFNEENAAFLQLLADQVAIAIRNANLYHQVNEFNLDLETLVHQRTLDLQNTYDKLERLDKAKSDFVTMASHELRTPLTVVQGYSQMLLDEPALKDDPRYFGLVKGIMSGVRRLLEIIESLLDVAKIDNRALTLYPTPLPIATLINSICESLLPEATERGIKLHQDLPGLPAIQADLDGVRKVFYNLIVNAIKFTPDGGRVTISGRTTEPGYREFSAPGIEIIIEDTGIGVDPQNQELIFYKFYSTEKVALHSSGKTKFKGKGTGLGLSIAKGIVEAHNGLIWVESPGYNEQECPGSKFHVILPLRQ